MKKIFWVFLIIFTLLALPMKSEAVTATSRAGIVQTDGTNLNVRASATTSSAIINKVGDNSYLTILSSSGNFYYVEYQEGKYGYVHKDYVAILSSNVKKVNTGGANLNVRYGPSTSYYQFEKVKDQDFVIILSNSGSFSKVLFEGNKIGYVSNNYLSNVTTSYNYRPVQLDVPSYKQFDSRWAYVPLGNSSAIMKSAGCLTTDMAMAESYRTGITYTPVTIQQKLSYNSSGNMYWPSYYTTSTTSSYLSTAYQLLHQNKPVLIGLKNQNGGQHWVLITGFAGGNTLSTNLFKVHDPGSSYNTQLNEVIAKYPYFYKIAYYRY